MDKYKYTGNYKSLESGYNKYTAPEINHTVFYAQLYPVQYNEDGSIFITKEIVTKRLIPTGQSSTKISGLNYIFDICHFNSDYCLLDNKHKKAEKRIMFLITSETIKKNNLTTVTEE